jgi:hypothetical protein
MIFDNWKKEWLRKNEDSLNKEFEKELNDIRESFNSYIDELNKKKESLTDSINKEICMIADKQASLSSISTNLDKREVELKGREIQLNQAIDTLESDYSKKIDSLRESFNQKLQSYEIHRESLECKIASQTLKLEKDYAELERIQESFTSKKKFIEAKDAEINEQLRFLEAKSSPSNAYITGFNNGFSKAWDMMMPLMTDGITRAKKLIEDNAIQETIRRNNGHYKKIN